MLRHLAVLALFLLIPAFARADVPAPPSYPSRIISLKPNVTRTLIALGAGDNIVGITKFCLRPNPEAGIVADYTSLQAEKIVLLKPDLVLSSVENSQSRQYAPLAAAGLNLEFLKFDTLDDLFASIGKIGSLLGKSATADDLLNRMKAGLATAKAAAKPWQGKTFAVIVQREPLMVAGGASFISTLLESSGLSNVFARNRIPYPVMGKESLLAKKPDLLFDMGMTRGPEWGTDYLGRRVYGIAIEEFLAAPQSVDALIKLLEGIAK
jgi:iron complex transport system substrate-binding protein